MCISASQECSALRISALSARWSRRRTETSGRADPFSCASPVIPQQTWLVRVALLLHPLCHLDSGKLATGISASKELFECLPTAGMHPRASTWGLRVCLRQAKTLFPLKGVIFPSMGSGASLITPRACSAHSCSRAFAFQLGFLCFPKLHVAPSFSHFSIALS